MFMRDQLVLNAIRDVINSQTSKKRTNILINCMSTYKSFDELSGKLIILNAS